MISTLPTTSNCSKELCSMVILNNKKVRSNILSNVHSEKHCRVKIFAEFNLQMQQNSD